MGVGELLYPQSSQAEMPEFLNGEVLGHDSIERGVLSSHFLRYPKQQALFYQ